MYLIKWSSADQNVKKDLSILFKTEVFLYNLFPTLNPVKPVLLFETAMKLMLSIEPLNIVDSLLKLFISYTGPVSYTDKIGWIEMFVTKSYNLKGLYINVRHWIKAQNKHKHTPHPLFLCSFIPEKKENMTISKYNEYKWIFISEEGCRLLSGVCEMWVNACVCVCVDFCYLLNK